MVDNSNSINISLGSIIRSTCSTLILDIASFCNRDKNKNTTNETSLKANVKEVRALIFKQNSTIKNLFSVVSSILIEVRFYIKLV